MKSGTCIHFKGVGLGGNKCCAAGINYIEAFDGKRPGVFLRMPCRSDIDRRGQAAIPCSLRVEPTDEQLAEYERESDEWFKRSMVAIKVAGEWRQRPKPTADRNEVVECPICKGNLHLFQSGYNGHVHGRCATDGCVRWME